MPVLFATEMHASVSLLLEMRDIAGVDSSPYLFANSMSDLGPQTSQRLRLLVQT